MASSTSGTSVAVFTCLCFFFLTFADQQQITVKTGDNVTLQCHHRGGDIQLLEWRRLNPEEDVFVCRHGKNDCSTPHPSFKNRVELRDPEMKDRDVSVILNNVTINDTGTYECYVRNSSTKPPPQLFNTTRLTVTDSDQQQITVKTGDNVTLQCHHRGGDIEHLEWRRQDLKEEVFVWKHGKMSDDNQHPSFKNRVELRDPEMKDGDVSVILKNVTIKDTGTYECRVRNNKTKPPPHLITTINLTVVNSGAAEHGGDKYGGKKDGGNKDGGNKDKGDKDGGDKDGGNKDKGDKDGGDKDGGDKDGRNKDVGDKHRHLKLVLTVFVSVILVGIVGIVCVTHRKCNGHFKKNSDVSLPDEAADQEPT
ncbi:V-set and immunoglobulin domain-containing protein 8-like isoform X1 [Channa argus]|uniref:V-set and immunoglobulin domain-containing protein 8-like isoform X1 n=2 Tax=Channa argus TaxID=215402 RepID=UPI002947102F|nr:hypothetical protein Q8A73_012493 [Channa argus]